jgi:hypothetical protein
MAPTAYRSGRLLMPQATEQAQNGPDQRLATNGLATTHDDARESFASGGSGPSRGLATAPPPHDRMILPALRGLRAIRDRPRQRLSTTAGLFTVESSHRWKHSASTPQVAGHRIKSFEPLTLDQAPMSPAV